MPGLQMLYAHAQESQYLDERCDMRMRRSRSIKFVCWSVLLRMEQCRSDTDRGQAMSE